MAEHATTSDHDLEPGISVVMASHNEETLIGDCLASVQGLASELIVVDGASSDRTPEIAREHGARVLETTNKLMLNLNKNLAISEATSQWILLLDPDERVSSELATEMRAIAHGDVDSPQVGYWMPRRNYELGRWIKAMGFYPGYQLRFFRNGHASFPCRHIHEMLEVDGPLGHLHGDLVHRPPQSMWTYITKRNLYSEHRAAYLFEEGQRFRLHRLLLEPPWQFFKAYVLRGGYREGLPGLIIGVTSGYGNFVQHVKLRERWQDRQTADYPEAEVQNRLDDPSTLTGDTSRAGGLN